MNDKLKTILADINEDLDQSKLKEYLANELDKEAVHHLETQMIDDPFLSDAVEGLQDVTDKNKISSVVFKLDQDLKARLKQKKARKAKRSYKDTINPYVAVVVILIVLAAFYLFVIKLLG